jgi:perosamine synthetase
MNQVRLYKLARDLAQWARASHPIGFIRGHSYLTEEQVGQIRKVLDSGEAEDVVREYEHRFAALIGPGNGLSFAVGRMAFFVLLKAWGVGSGDEVILPGFTCSVMPNAVWRLGAKPVFADIDPETLGSSASGIVSKITARTKAVVAQHSFGIPCHMPEIVEICRKQDIPVIEDCAITLDSASDGVKAGNWGDGAIFSTDHSKPLNTLVGGFLYVRDPALYQRMQRAQESLPHLRQDHQIRLFQQFLFERRYYEPEKYQRGKVLHYLRGLAKEKLSAERQAIFLEGDYRQPSSHSSYPYPAQMPPFLAQLGLLELARWNSEKARRKNLLAHYLRLAQETGLTPFLPRAYLDPHRDIVPLRLAFSHPAAAEMQRKMSRLIDVRGTWFQAPIICCPDGPESLGYVPGSCPTSERLGAHMVNWPCVVPEEWQKTLLSFFKEINSNDKL